MLTVIISQEAKLKINFLFNIYNSFISARAEFCFSLDFPSIILGNHRKVKSVMDKSNRMIYRIVSFLVRLFYPEIHVEGSQYLPQEPCIIVSNHAQVHGPIAAELFVPGVTYTWCSQEMMHLKEVPGYAYQDFWSEKPRWCRWFYKLLSYLIAPVAVCIFNNAHTIPVYRDGRVKHTFRKTVETLKNGVNVLIFPEHGAPYDHILCDFQRGFVDVARSYYKQTGKALQFVPMYLAPKLKKLYFGAPVTFDPEAPVRQERERICGYLMETISQTAQALPRHTVIPYHNISKKEYGCNIKQEETQFENTCG